MAIVVSTAVPPAGTCHFVCRLVCTVETVVLEITSCGIIEGVVGHGKAGAVDCWVEASDCPGRRVRTLSTSRRIMLNLWLRCGLPVSRRVSVDSTIYLVQVFEHDGDSSRYVGGLDRDVGRRTGNLILT